MKHRIKEGECVVTHTDEERLALGFETNLGVTWLQCTRAEVIDPCTALRRNMSSISFADFMAREAEAKETTEPKARENENQLNRVRTYLADLISVGECVNINEPAHIHDIADYIRLSMPTVKVQDMLSAAENDGLIRVKKYPGDIVVWMDVSAHVDDMKAVVHNYAWDLRVKASGWVAYSVTKQTVEVDFSEVETAAKLHEEGRELLAKSRKAVDVPKEKSYNIEGAQAENFLLASLRADVKRMLEIAEVKNHDYGGKDSNPFANFMAVEHLGAASAEAGITVRMTDKLSRIITLLNKEAKVGDESISDTLLDLANYALILKALIAYKK